MNLARQSTMIVVAVPLLGAALAAGATDELLNSPMPAAAVAWTSRPPDAKAATVTVPLASLLAAASARPAPIAPYRVPTPMPPVRSMSHPIPIPPPPPDASVRRRDFLVSADGTLSTPVGIYSDCTGRSPLERMEAAIDICYSAPSYFVGHNLGVFTPLMHMGVGALITYYDGAGQAHLWRVVFIHDGWPIGPGRPPPAGPGVVAQFQTCTTGNGSVGRVLDVVSA